MTDIHRFYRLMADLGTAPGQGRTLGEYTGRHRWPYRGVYFFFEPGELRISHSKEPRVVRVGTHAVSADSKSSLWGRLRAHRGTGSGSGNHRSSIFRLHVGSALLSTTGGQLPTWGQKAPRSGQVRQREAAHEQRVSQHICAMSVRWVEISDEPGTQSDRGVIERNSIALLSNQFDPGDPPSDNWLGLKSPRDEIRRSGLWNLNHVSEQHATGFLDTLEHYVALTLKRATPTGSPS